MADKSTTEQSVEQWRDVAGFEGRYQVSSHGQVRSLRAPNGRQRKTPKILKPTYDDRATRIGLTVNYKSRPRLLHRLVLETFVGPCPEGLEGSHLDGNYRNNRLDNLCWETHLENVQRMEAHGTKRRGERIPQSKLTDKLVIESRRRVAQGERISRIASEIGVSHGTLSVAVRGLTWTHIPMS